jgi:deazaflavin-dependent oxidoreductase (nitroreductase family)
MGAVRPHPPRVGWFTRTGSYVVSTRPGAWFFVNVASRLDRILMPLTRGRIRVSMRMPSLLLTHRGAKSGVERTTPLTYFTQDDDVILIASKGGDPKHPAWYHNLRAHPEVTLSHGGPGDRYVARDAEGEERDRLFRAACGMYPGYARYQARCPHRTIPVLVLSPKA